jgi:hypothetical protein
MSRAGQPGWVLVVSTLAITLCGAAAQAQQTRSLFKRI